MLKIHTILLILTLFLSACVKDPSPKNIKTLLSSKSEWKIQQYTINQKTTTLNNQNETFILGFKENQIFGIFGCNNFFGTYSLNNHTLLAGEVGITKKMCEESILAIESLMIQEFFGKPLQITTTKNGITFSSETFSLEIK